jgi:hypothetical protein
MSIFSVVIIAAAFVMLYSSAILFAGLDYGEKAVRNSLSVPVSSCGIVDFSDDMDAKEAVAFMDQILARDEVKAIGNYEKIEYSDWTPELLPSGDENAADVQAIVMNSELLAMQNIELYCGDNPGVENKGKYRMLLGYNFREIPIGTIFQNEELTCEVSGIMQKGTYLTQPEMLTWNLSGLRLSYKTEMDNRILILIPEGEYALGVRNIFCAEDGYTYEEAVAAMQEVSAAHGTEVKTGTLQAREDSVFSENRQIKNRIDAIAVILCISIFMISITVQLLHIYMKRNELGIWLANGMARREVFEILWLENLVKIALGWVIAVILEYLFVRFQFGGSPSVCREIYMIMFGKPLVELVLFALLLSALISAIPIGLIAKRSTSELVKGVWS